VIAYVLFHDVIGTASNQTLPVLINELVPTGLKGLISAAVLAALLSAVSAALNSSGKLVAVDIVKRVRPETSDRGFGSDWPDQFHHRNDSSGTVVLSRGRFSSIFEAITSLRQIWHLRLRPSFCSVFSGGVVTKEASIVTLIAGFLIGALSFVARSAGLRYGKDHHSPPGDFLHDASLVGVLHLQCAVYCG